MRLSISVWPGRQRSPLDSSHSDSIQSLNLGKYNKKLAGNDDDAAIMLLRSW